MQAGRQAATFMLQRLLFHEFDTVWNRESRVIFILNHRRVKSLCFLVSHSLERCCCCIACDALRFGWCFPRRREQNWLKLLCREALPYLAFAGMWTVVSSSSSSTEVIIFQQFKTFKITSHSLWLKMVNLWVCWGVCSLTVKCLGSWSYSEEECSTKFRLGLWHWLAFFVAIIHLSAAAAGAATAAASSSLTAACLPACQWPYWFLAGQSENGCDA